MSQGVVKREGQNLFILEKDEYCCVCKSTDWDSLRLIGFGEQADPLKFMVCDGCFDSGAFKKFLAEEFEKAMADAPDQFRKNPDGTWSIIKDELEH